MPTILPKKNLVWSNNKKLAKKQAQVEVPDESAEKIKQAKTIVNLNELDKAFAIKDDEIQNVSREYLIYSLAVMVQKKAIAKNSSKEKQSLKASLKGIEVKGGCSENHALVKQRYKKLNSSTQNRYVRVLDLCDTKKWEVERFIAECREHGIQALARQSTQGDRPKLKKSTIEIEEIKGQVNLRHNFYFGGYRLFAMRVKNKIGKDIKLLTGDQAFAFLNKVKKEL